jgi:hypothetical protein
LSARAVPPRQLWLLIAGFGVWCSALVVLYTLHAFGCAFAWPTGALRLGLVATLLIHLAVLGWMCRDQTRRPPDPELGATAAFFRWVIAGSLIAAIVAAVLVLGPPLLLSTCV